MSGAQQYARAGPSSTRLPNSRLVQWQMAGTSLYIRIALSLCAGMQMYRVKSWSHL
uniref:Uncharacterized protein n=1 Tax=Spironucleus salmonicida TaxID=348837 RepID=V6LBY0_9EUKA|eukprot:EST41967.1 Hypothetical protein SS50377_18272 [Spironucleus salmonicida]